jgi:hypothetical protein
LRYSLRILADDYWRKLSVANAAGRSLLVEDRLSCFLHYWRDKLATWQIGVGMYRTLAWVRIRYDGRMPSSSAIYAPEILGYLPRVAFTLISSLKIMRLRKTGPYMCMDWLQRGGNRGCRIIDIPRTVIDYHK